MLRIIYNPGFEMSYTQLHQHYALCARSIVHSLETRQDTSHVTICLLQSLVLHLFSESHIELGQYLIRFNCSAFLRNFPWNFGQTKTLHINIDQKGRAVSHAKSTYAVFTKISSPRLAGGC